MSANAVVDRFRKNYRGFWDDYRWFIIIFGVALLFDGISTTYFMLEHGPDAELHPVIRFVSSQMLGPVAGPLLAVIGKGFAGIIVGIYCRRLAAYIFVVASIISLLAAAYNFWGYKLYPHIF